MKAFRFLCVNLVWFVAWFMAFFLTDKAVRDGVFTWQNWQFFVALFAIAASAFLVARWHTRSGPARGPVSLDCVACALTLVVNSLVAFVAFAVAILFIYGE